MARVYNYVVIATGIMFLLLIGGVETSSSKIVSAIGGTGPSLWASSALWVAVIAAMAGFLATNRISAGGFSFQASRESVMAGFMSLVYVFFASDLFSIVSKVGETSCPATGGIASCSWEYWLIWAMVMPLMVGFAISILSYIGGSD